MTALIYLFYLAVLALVVAAAVYVHKTRDQVAADTGAETGSPDPGTGGEPGEDRTSPGSSGT